jgi:hypothetical protein
VIAHIVLFTPKHSVSHADLLAFAQSITETLSSVGSVGRAVVGRRIDVDPGYSRSFGESTYEFAAVIEFADEPALVQYLTHPLHHALGRMFWEKCEATVIVEIRCADGKDASAVRSLVR